MPSPGDQPAGKGSCPTVPEKPAYGDVAPGERGSAAVKKDVPAGESAPADEGASGKKPEPGRVIRGVGWNLVGMIAGSIAGFLSSILLARYLGSSEYGELALTLSVLNVLVIFTALGFEFALNKYIPVFLCENNPAGIRSLVRKLTWMKVAVSLALSVFILLAADLIAAYLFQKPELGAYLRVLCLMVLPYSLESIYRGLLTGLYRQKFINLLDVATKVLYLVLALAALLLSYGVTGVLFANLIAMAFFISLAARKGLASIPEGGKPGETVHLSRVLRYSFYLYIFTVMNFVLGQQLDLMMIGAMVPDIRQVSFYTIAYSFSYISVSLLSLMLGGGITLTYFSELYARKDFDGLRRGYIILCEYLFVYVMPISIIGAVLAPDLLYLIYGEPYAGTDVVLLLALYFLSMNFLKFGGVTSTFLSAMDQERKLVISRTIFGLTNIILNFLLIPHFKAFGALIGTGVACLVGNSYESVILHRSLGPRYPKRFWGRMVLLSVTAGLAAYDLRFILAPLAPSGGNAHAAFMLAGVGIPWLLLTLGLFLLLKPLSPETVEVVEKVPLPAKGLLLRLLR